ncbi:MAG: LytR family transcriptional regulator [Streptosporangiales bacterium]|nr:LytR family transcriptional regulator [Streptosporangiales bacterium]
MTEHDRPADAGDEAVPEAGEPRRRRWPRRLAIASGLVLILVAGLTAVVLERQSAYNSNIERLTGVFPTNKDRPAKSGTDAENWLLVGSDRRATSGTTGDNATQRLWRPGAQRADTIMLVHVPADKKKVQLISFPRDSYVDIPGRGKNKINAAFSFGGPPLLIQTIEKLTKSRVDHFAVLDFNGFAQMTDAVGGVDVKVAKTVRDPKSGIVWQAGTNHLDGKKALAFVRQRHGLSGGDFSRIERQQAFLRALAAKVASAGTLTNPLKLNSLLEALTSSVSVDGEVTAGTLRNMAIGLRGVRPGDITFLTVPTRGTGMVGGQSMVFLDARNSAELFQALRSDDVASFLKRGGKDNDVRTVS